MAYCTDDTITAVASAPGGAVRGIVRISGLNAIKVLENCFCSSDGKPLSELPTAQVVIGTVSLGSAMGEIPADLYLWPTRRSYTRQPAGELHTIGSAPVLHAIVQRLCSEGARLAEPGEFTMRAFLGGRIDLTQAEAVLGIINAPNQQMLDVALSQLAGGLAAPLMRLRSELLGLLAHVEAGLDFAEEDIAFIDANELEQQLTAIGEHLAHLFDQLDLRRHHVDKSFVVLRGQANAGKSSLLNALVGQDVAIVSECAGTTRDYVSHQVRWEGMAIVLIDTAGLQRLAAQEPVDASARQLADQQLRQADLELFCIDASRPVAEVEHAILRAGQTPNRILVATKIDVGSVGNALAAGVVPTSSVAGIGLCRLREEVCRMLQGPSTGLSSALPTTASRCTRALKSASQAIETACRLARQGLGDELVAAEIRNALGGLGQVVGTVYTDDILDRVFGQFCIGK